MRKVFLLKRSISIDLLVQAVVIQRSSGEHKLLRESDDIDWMGLRRQFGPLEKDLVGLKRPLASYLIWRLAWMPKVAAPPKKV